MVKKNRGCPLSHCIFEGGKLDKQISNCKKQNGRSQYTDNRCGLVSSTAVAGIDHIG